MAIPSKLLQNDSIRKFLCVEITDASGNVYRMTDKSYLYDKNGNLYKSIILPGYYILETTGTRSGIYETSGSGIGGSSESNELFFNLDSRLGPDGSGTDYIKSIPTGSTVSAKIGPMYGEDFLPFPVESYKEVFFGFVESIGSGSGQWSITCRSPEGWRVDENLVDSSFLGYGYGITCDNQSENESPPDAYLVGSMVESFDMAYSGFSFSTIASIQYYNPSDGSVDFTIFDLNDKIVAKIRMSDNYLEVKHKNATETASVVFDEYAFLNNDDPYKISYRYDGSAGYLYLNSNLIQSKPISVDPDSGETDIWLFCNSSLNSPMSGTIYEFWLSNVDIGDSEIRIRSNGPIEYDYNSQSDIVVLLKMLEGAEDPPPSSTNDFLLNLSMSLEGTAVFDNSFQGDDPSVNQVTYGKSKPFLYGTVYNIEGALLELSSNRFIFNVSDSEILKARSDGAPLQIGYSSTSVHRMAQSPFNAFESEAMARVCFAEDLTIARPGTRIEVSGGHANDGTYTVSGVIGGRFVEVYPNFPVQDISSIVTVTIPESGVDKDVLDNGDGTATTISLNGKITFDAKSEPSGPQGLRGFYTFLMNAKGRQAGTDISGVGFTGIDIQWIGADDDGDIVFSMAAPFDGDKTTSDCLTELLDSYFAWSSDAPRVDISEEGPPDLVPSVRMGHYVEPDGSGNVISEIALDNSSIIDHDSAPPAWRVIATYKPNFSELSDALGVTQSERKSLSDPNSKIEVLNDQGIKTLYPSAEAIEWSTNFFNSRDCVTIGQRAANFLSVQRRWRTFFLRLFPGSLLVGSQFGMIAEKINSGIYEDFFVVSVRHEITKRGITVTTYS